MKKKVMVIAMVLFFMLSIAPNYGVAENEKSEENVQWFFLMSGPSGGFSTAVFVVVGPFQDKTVCKEVAEWAKEHNAQVSRIWAGQP